MANDRRVVVALFVRRFEESGRVSRSGPSVRPILLLGKISRYLRMENYKFEVRRKDSGKEVGCGGKQVSR